MKWFKKYAAVVLAAVLACNMCALAVQEESQAAAENGEAIQVLLDLQVMQNTADGTFNPDGILTRADLAAAAAVMGGLSALHDAETLKTMYSDYYLFEANAGLIDAAVQQGLIATYSDGQFRPDEAVTYDDVFETCLKLLGYDVYAQNMGGGEAGYLQALSRSGLAVVGGSRQETAKRGVTAEILYRALETDMLRMVAMGDSYEYQEREGCNLLTERMDLQVVEGRVTANEWTAVDADRTMPAGFVQIDGQTYREAETGVSALLGYQVKAYCSAEDGETLRAAVKIGKEEELLADATDLIGYSGNVLEYADDNGKVRNQRISVSADIIYNGKAYPACPNELFIPALGSVRVITDTDGTQTVFITDYEVCVVDAVNVDDSIVYGRYNKPMELRLDGPDVSSIITDSDGNPSSMGAMEVGSVLLVAASAQKSLYTIQVVTQTVFGEVEGIERDVDGISGLQIGGLSYPVSSKCSQEELNAVLPGDSGTAYLAGGEIVSFQKGSDAGVYTMAYLDKVKRKQDGLDQAVCLRLFTQDGVFAELDCSETMYLDSQSVDTMSVLAELEAAADTVVRYTLDSEGLIKRLDLAYTAEAGKNDADTQGLRLEYKSTSALNYRSSPKSFAGKANVDENTVIFSIPDEDANGNRNEDMYSIYATSNLKQGTTYMIDSYRLGPDYGVADAAVLHVSLTAFKENISAAAVIERITEAVDENGEPVQMLYGYNNSGAVNVVVGDPAILENITPGDVIRWQTFNGKAVNIQEIFDEETRTIVNLGGQSYHSGNYFIYADVYSYSDGLYLLTTEDVTQPLTRNDLLSFILTACPMYVYDEDARVPLVEGSAADISDYQHTGTASKMLLHTQSGTPKLLVVYK